ncbi:unnamed protein product [Caenorhabditis angaria]|uniref:ATP citrate synthase n=1 Tax=Caenorhabditis angaria TaxID=860376 RepID=A0A9P1N9L8_9PELO|nr:unnamed protein product [Caenorhabditis angaria]
MSAKAVSELSAKEILYKYFEGTGLVNSPFAFHVKTGDDFNQIAGGYEWLTKAGKGVIKPDQLIKHCAKRGLIKIGSPEELSDWFNSHANRQVEVDESLGRLHTFIVEPFCAHQEFDEMYIAIFSTREEDTIMFYEHGGVTSPKGDIERKARFIKIPVEFDDDVMWPTDGQLKTLIGVDLPNFEVVKKFVDELYKAYKELHFTYLEIDPFVFVDNQIHILDLASKLDETANFICSDKWRSRQTPMSAPMPVDFPAPFGSDLTEEEQFIANLDAKTGASLKLTILNRKGRVWTIIDKSSFLNVLTDTVCDLGGEKELGNYGECSGHTWEKKTFEYAKTILSIMTEGEPRSDGKVLIISGSIAFRGIIQAMNTYKTKLKKHEVTVFVYCRGTNYEEGWRYFERVADQLKIPVRFYDSDTHVTAIVGAALGTHYVPSMPIEPKTTGQFLLSPERNTAGTERQPVSPAPTSTEAKPLNQTTFRGLFENDTKAIIWGEQADVIQGMLDFDYVCRRETPSVVASTCPFTEGNTHKYNFGLKEVLIPAYKSMAKACATHPEASVMVIFDGPLLIYESVLEALEFPQLKVIAIIAEGVPENRTRKLLKVAAKRGVTLIGPATVGGIKPGCFKIGYTGGEKNAFINSKLYRPGSVAYVSRSDGMSNELNNIISQNTNGVYEGIAIGGGKYTGSSYVEHIARYQADDRVKMIVLLGEVGGTEEYKIAEMLNRGEITKPLVAWCIGTCADRNTNAVRYPETAACKNALLRSVGAIVPSSFGELGNKIRDTYDNIGAKVPQLEVGEPPFPMDYAWAKKLGLTCKEETFMASICDKWSEDFVYGGAFINNIMQYDQGVASALGLLWFEKSLPAYANKFIEICLQLTADHDRDVSGAHNTIVCGRAGKNLISSLTSGSLTIGDRFGGALDGAARQFSYAMDNGWSPMEFVHKMRIQNKHIMGIGHRAESINNPDKRVEILKRFVMDKSQFTQGTPLLDFALEVEKIMNSKNPNLILNVDGAIGVIFVDILRQSKLFSPAEAQEIIDSRTLNGLLIFGRSFVFVGYYLYQSRLKQGLYHHPWADIEYVMPEQIIS